VEIRELGRIEYREALALQQRLRAERQAGAIGDVLLLLEHDPVYTRGRRTPPGEMPAAMGIPVVDVDRGGRITYHGPGQLVGYPICAITDVVGFVRSLEQVVIDALAEDGIAARSRAEEGADFMGVWVEDRKIASVGVHVNRGVTTHGLAVNVDGDLAPWEWIVPCGLSGVRMTSVLEEAGRADMAAFQARIAERFASGRWLLSKT
jgi:lipoyl(octanoyl) transferase